MTYALKTSGRSESRGVEYDILEELQSKATIRREKYNTGRKIALMAATYILVALEGGWDSGNILDHLLGILQDPKPLLWVETCKGFEQYIAIHFDSGDFGLFDRLLQAMTTPLLFKSTPDYLNIVDHSEPYALSVQINNENLHSVSHTVLTSFNQESISLLTCIDSPIYRTHQYLMDHVIHQVNLYDNYDGTDHGTFVVGVLMQINSNVEIYSFPAVEIFHHNIELSQEGTIFSGISKISLALTAFLNTNSKVDNLALGHKSGPEVKAFLTPLMDKLRSKGCILVVAAGNAPPNDVGIDISNDDDNLFAPFVDLETGDNNIVLVAAVDQAGQLAPFSNYGRTKVMLAAPGVKIQSCSFPPNEFKIDDGTSFAAPQVAATLAIMMELFPTEDHTQLIARLMKSVVKDDSLRETTISGGRLNIRQALDKFHPLRLILDRNHRESIRSSLRTDFR